MDITFDSAKDSANIANHGVSLGLAGQFEWDSAVVWPDGRFAYDEVRMCVLGFVGITLFYLVFVDEGESLRLISLRRATRLEMKRYAET